MLLNQYVILYYFFLLISLGLMGMALVVGLGTYLRWQKALAPDHRLQLGTKFYLSAAAMNLGLWIKIIGIPLYFIMLQSLVPSIPGAMCLAGVHISVPYYSWTASILKLILPVFYITWIVFNSADKKIASQPFLHFRYSFLLPLSLLVLIESWVDFKFLWSLQPVKVVCCTAIFDFTSRTIPLIISESHWGFVLLFCLFLVIQNAFVLRTKKNNGAFLAICTLSLVLLVSLLFAQHTKLSPLLLNAPFHHCIFCLLAIKKAVLFGSCLILVGTYAGFSYGLLACVAGQKNVLAQITPTLLFFKRMVLVGINTGTALIFFSVIGHYLF